MVDMQYVDEAIDFTLDVQDSDSLLAAMRLPWIKHASGGVSPQPVSEHARKVLREVGVVMGQAAQDMADGLDYHGALSALLWAATVQHAPYPQYIGYFDSATLCRFDEQVSTKGGEQFERGDYALLLDRGAAAFGSDEWRYTAVSWRTGSNIAFDEAGANDSFERVEL